MATKKKTAAERADERRQWGLTTPQLVALYAQDLIDRADTGTNVLMLIKSHMVVSARQASLVHSLSLNAPNYGVSKINFKKSPYWVIGRGTNHVYPVANADDLIALLARAYPRVSVLEDRILAHLQSPSDTAALGLAGLFDLIAEKSPQAMDAFIAAHNADPCVCTNRRVVEIMMALGANPRARGPNGVTWLHRMAQHDAVEAAQVLLRAGVSATLSTDTGKTPLHDERLSADMARLLVEHGAKVNAKNKEGLTPLLAVYDADAARALIELGANVHCTDPRNKQTLLHREGLSQELMKLYLEAGCDPAKADDCGDLPIHLNISERQDLAKILLDAWPACVHVANQYGRTPLHTAVDTIEYGLCKEMVRHGADPWAKDNDDQSPVDLLQDWMKEAARRFGKSHRDYRQARAMMTWFEANAKKPRTKKRSPQ